MVRSSAKRGMKWCTQVLKWPRFRWRSCCYNGYHRSDIRSHAIPIAGTCGCFVFGPFVVDVGGECVAGGAEFHWGMLHREVVGRGDWRRGGRWTSVVYIRWCGVAGAARLAMSLFAWLFESVDDPWGVGRVRKPMAGQRHGVRCFVGVLDLWGNSGRPPRLLSSSI